MNTFISTKNWYIKPTKNEIKKCLFIEKRNKEFCSILQVSLKGRVLYLATIKLQIPKQYISSTDSSVIFREFMRFALQRLHFHRLQQQQPPSIHRSLLFFQVQFQSKTRVIKWEKVRLVVKQIPKLWVGSKLLDDDMKSHARDHTHQHNILE